MAAMQRPVLSVETGYHLRAKPLWDGRVKMDNFELKAVPFAEDGRGHQEFLAGDFAAGEFSLASYLMLKSRGEPLMAIPVFPNRKFRHSYIFVRHDSRLEEPANLRGKRVGIPAWLNTCGLWVRGILSDEYGVKPEDIHWIARRSGPLDGVLAVGIRLETVSGEASLGARLLNGEFDAIIIPDFPEEDGIRRLFRDSKAVEQDFYKRTQIFPTSHAVVFKEAYLKEHPSAAGELFSAWYRAKSLALEDDADATYSNFAWVRQTWEEQRALLGADPWKYGIQGNEKALRTIIRYAGEQGLLKRKVTIGDLFLPMEEPQK
jgi:4,5-dihydroxyphthalate decarboxylase